MALRVKLRAALRVFGGVALIVLMSLYTIGYVWARATHRLVNYGGTFIARPHAMSGIGVTVWELLFAPAIWVESAVRRRLPR